MKSFLRSHQCSTPDSKILIHQLLEENDFQALVIVPASKMSFRHASPIETFEDKFSRNLCSE